MVLTFFKVIQHDVSKGAYAMSTSVCNWINRAQCSSPTGISGPSTRGKYLNKASISLAVSFGDNPFPDGFRLFNKQEKTHWIFSWVINLFNVIPLSSGKIPSGCKCMLSMLICSRFSKVWKRFKSLKELFFTPLTCSKRSSAESNSKSSWWDTLLRKRNEDSKKCVLLSCIVPEQIQQQFSVVKFSTSPNISLVDKLSPQNWTNRYKYMYVSLTFNFYTNTVRFENFNIARVFLNSIKAVSF